MISQIQKKWTAGDVAVIRNQEAKKVRDIGSLIFETPIRHDYEAGVEVRSLLSTEQLEEIDGRLAVLDVDPISGTRFVKFYDSSKRERIPLGGGSPDARERVPNVEGSTPPRVNYPRTPPPRRPSLKRMFATFYGAIERMVL